MSSNEFKPIPGFDGYEIAQNGIIHNLNTGNFVYGSIGQDGYRKATLYKDGKRVTPRVHRLVALAWLPNPENKPYVSFKDQDITHVTADNLLWSDIKEITDSAFACGHRSIESLKQLGYKKRKLTMAQAEEVRWLRKEGMSFVAMAKHYGASAKTIQDIAHYQLYREGSA